MNFECILYDKEQGVATIKLNRPGVLNAMNKQLWLDFKAALEDAGNDPQVKALIITGEGRAFSTGADLKESKTSKRPPERLSVSKNRLSQPLMDMPWAPAMNWRWPVIFASQPKRPKSGLPKQRSHLP